MSVRPTAPLIDELTTAASHAAAAILAIRKSGATARLKSDRTPVTEADHAAQDIILAALARVLPGMPAVSEEAKFDPGVVLGETFILVDPLDGTKEFLNGSDEFTVNIALVCGGVPTAGIVFAPARGIVWRGLVGSFADRLELEPGTGVDAARSRGAIRTRPAPQRGLVALTSRSHADPASEGFLARLRVAEEVPCGSSLKFCLIAEGAADVYPRLAPTSEWDLAAGHAIVAAAGGSVVAPAGGPLPYGGRDRGFRVAGFVAWGDPGASGRQVA